MTTDMKTSSLSRVRRGAKRASYDKQAALQLITDLKLGHLGFVEDGLAVVIPITIWVHEQSIYLHVANKSRIHRVLESGQQVCLSVAECSEWVLAKSAYHHSANYRSAVLYCQGSRVEQEAEFDAVFKTVINELEPERWDQVRAPNVRERKATALFRLDINEGAFKSRSGGPVEEAEDMALPVWHGVKPACPFHR